MTDEQKIRIQFLRQKARAGTLTIEETREGLVLMRADRLVAANASTGKKRVAAEKAAPVDTKALLGGLKRKEA